MLSQGEGLGVYNRTFMLYAELVPSNTVMMVMPYKRADLQMFPYLHAKKDINIL